MFLGWANMTCKKKCLQVWAIRPNYPTLIKALEGRYDDYSAGPVHQQSGGSTLIQFVHLAAAPVILRSTEELSKVSAWCIKQKYFEIFFPNYELFCISKYRGKRIFGDSRFRLHFYQKNPDWHVINCDYFEKNDKKPRTMTCNISVCTTVPEVKSDSHEKFINHTTI